MQEFAVGVLSDKTAVGTTLGQLPQLAFCERLSLVNYPVVMDYPPWIELRSLFP